MTKKFYLTAALLASATLFGGATMQAETRSVKLTTSKAVGTEITLLVNYTYNGVTVDWGDGDVQTYNTGKDIWREITGTVKGSVITITGDGLWNTLSCPSCGVTAIDLTEATGLESLYCQNNELTTLDLRGMNSLRDLNVSSNALTSITYTSPSYPENDLTSIENINLANNQLTGSFVVRNSKVQTIDISNNQFSKVYVTSNPNLDQIKCANNQLTSLNLSKCTSITSIICNNNQLTALTLPSTTTTLYQLVCDNNSIKSTFDLTGNESLTDVSVSNNAISSLALPSSVKLSSLNVSNNQLTFNVLPKKAQRPTYIAFMPQAQIDISSYENVQTKDNVAYMPVVEWSERTTAPIDLGLLRFANRNESSNGTLEGKITWHEEDADGNATELTAGKTSTNMGDYYMTNGKTTFFTAHAKAFARITANTAYKDLAYYVETTRIAIGEESVTSISAAAFVGGLQVQARRGLLTLTADSPVKVNIFATDGKNVWNGTVGGTTTVSLPSGIYIVNGKKVAL